MSHTYFNSSNEECGITNAENDTKDLNKSYCHPIDLQISQINNYFEIPPKDQSELSFHFFSVFSVSENQTDETNSGQKSDLINNQDSDSEENPKKHDKKNKKHKGKGKTVFHHVVRSNTLTFKDFQGLEKEEIHVDNLNDIATELSSSSQSFLNSDSPLNPSSKPPPSSNPPPPPPRKPPPSSCPPPPPKKPPSSSNPPPPPPKKKPPPSSCPPPPPSKKALPLESNSTESNSPNPPPSSKPPPPPPKKPPPSSKPPPKPSSSPVKQPTEMETNIPLSKSRKENVGDNQRPQMRMGRSKSKTICGGDIFRMKYVPVDAPKDTSSIEDVLQSSTSNTFLIPTSSELSNKPFSEQQIIQSYFLKKNESKDQDEDEIVIDDNNFDKNSRKSKRIRFDRNSSYSNSVFSNLVNSEELQKLAEQSLKEYNESLNNDNQGNEHIIDNSNENLNDENSFKKSESRHKISPASSNPENLEKLAEMNKKAKKILIKRFKKMLENYISEVEINSDFIEIDTSRDSTIHWRKDPHLIKTNELRVESRELENKIASIRIENKDLQNNITELYQTIGSKNQELMMLQNEISRLKGPSDTGI